MVRPVAVLLALGAIAGCRETHHCGPGESYQGGVCAPFDASVDAASPDTGLDGGAPDTGTDVGVDASNDAGFDTPDPCDFCGTRQCYVPGTSDTGAIDGGSAHVCVECTDDSQCGDHDAGVGDGGVAPAGRWLCRDFACTFGCDVDSDCGATGACRPDHTCSAYPRYPMSDVACSPCDTDANCAALPDHACIHWVYQNGSFMDLGPANFCLLHHVGCGSFAPPLDFPWPSHPPTTIDGTAIPASETLCVSRTSCQAVTDTNHHRACTGASSDECGLDGIIDATCDTARSLCTYACVGAEDCPPLAPSCSGAPSVCR